MNSSYLNELDIFGTDFSFLINGKSNIKFSAPWHQEFPTQGFSSKSLS